MATLAVDDDPLGASSSASFSPPPAAAASAATPTVDPPPSTEDAEGLGVVRRLDFAALAPFDDAGYGDALLGATGLKVDVSSDAHVVAALRRAIFTTHDGDGDSRPDAAGVRVCVNLQSLQLLSDGRDLQLDDDELVTDVKWIGTEYVGASYSSGVLRVFSRAGGKLVFEQKLDVSRNASSTVGARRVDVHLQAPRDAEGELWILYEDATVAILQLSELFAKISSAVFGPAQASKFRKYLLRDQSEIVGALPCGPVRPTIFQSHPRLGVCTIVSAGADPFLSFYHAGNDQNSIIHLAHIATAMASRAAGAIWSFAKSWGWGSAGEDPSPAGDTANGYAGASDAGDDAAEHVAAPVGSVRSFAEDARRRSRCLALSPTGRLAAVTDTLGRVLLVDTSRMLVIRMWKGYRNAQCGWMQGREGATRPPGLYLVIYSAQRGIVEVWRARFGPRVFSFAVGDNARLFTVPDASGKAAARCIVLAASPSGGGAAELIELQPSLPNLSILMKYFTQNKLQEEKFLLHQITAGLHAFVAKKKADRHHVLEQDAIEPLLDDMASLSSTTTIETLLELLMSSDMVLLSPRFLLKALEKIQVALKREMTSRIPTGPELSILWKTLWQHRILSAFIGLHAEFERSKRVALANIEVSSAVLTKHGAAKGGDPSDASALGRMFPWLELFRRAGYALDDDACANTRDVLERATRLTPWEFLELFSMPFSDPELPRRRDILALFEQHDKSERFVRETLRTLQASVFRSNTGKVQRSVLLALAFTPVLSSVFAVQELQQVHASIFLSHETHTQMFLEWFFALPLGTVLALPAPTPSSSLQRWLQPYFATTTDGSDEDELAARTAARTLFPCSAPLAEVFTACWKTTKLFHAFVLSVHCEWGETQHAKRLEEATLGKVSSAGGGVRWRVLQDAIAKTVHLSLRLGRLGRLSVDAVEHVDEILRALALMELNDSANAEPVGRSVGERRASVSGDSAALDDWVASMEHCRNASQMRDWQSVLVRFPQFADTDALGCFRVLLLCTAWNAERSDMHQLDDALAELEALSSPALQAAMATHVWEKFIRVHVVTLISFWEESAAGRKPQRGLQPQIARRFFGIIKSLLVILLAAVSACASEAAVDSDDEPDESDDASGDDDDEPRAVDDDGDDVPETQRPEHRMEFLTFARVSWTSRVKDLPEVFRRRWPPAHNRSSLIRSLAGFSVQSISQSQVSDHLSLVLLLDSFAATSVTPVSIVKLFGGHGRLLCRPDSFVRPPASPDAPSAKRETRGDHPSVTHERTQFLKQLLRHDESLSVALAEAFGLSMDMIREEHVLFLYQSGRDELAELSLDRMRSPERLGLRLASIARARLSLILQRMKAEAEFATLMSFLPADVFAWVVSEALPPLVADAQVQKLDRVPSLTGTHYLLLKCLAVLPSHLPEFAKVSAMSVLVKDIISQVKQHPSMATNRSAVHFITTVTTIAPVSATEASITHVAPTRVQKVYRGHRSRLSTELKLLALREKNRWRAKAATTIQKIMRAFLAKACVRQLRQEHDAELVRLARSWV
ncbi:hypothetical protein PybrP1_010228, partial [[Pythium] brassicae (nom. inval.)]